MSPRSGVYDSAISGMASRGVRDGCDPEQESVGRNMPTRGAVLERISDGGGNRAVKFEVVLAVCSQFEQPRPCSWDRKRCGQPLLGVDEI